jgi:hypothetical protein
MSSLPWRIIYYFFNKVKLFQGHRKDQKENFSSNLFKTLIDLSLDFFKNYALRFHLGVSRLFGHTVCICKIFYAGLKYVIIFVCFRLIWIIHIRFHHPHD